MDHQILPQNGRPEADVLEDLQSFAARDPHYKEGRLWSLVYHLDDAHDRFLSSAYAQYASANGLNPAAFQSLKRMETEVISILAGLLNGGPDTCGVMTAGGTESCLMAVKTYRDMARKRRKVRRPNMILPETAHVAWFKASEYFGVKVRLLPIGTDHTPDLSKLPKLINSNTVMVLGSAPEYPFGQIDPIEKMAATAQDHKVPLHVDACVGGFILPFMEMNGVDFPPWDFRVPGVTSISADLHKYGYAAKGASTILYRDLETLKHQMFVYEEWPGGIFASPALLGTRPGGAYAAAWATLQKIGTDGYRALARQTCEAVEQMKAGMEDIDGLAVIGAPTGPLIAYRSIDKKLDIFAVAAQMEQSGWSMNRTQKPDGIHAMVTAQHLAVVEQYLADLKDAVETVRRHPEIARTGSAATYGMMSHVPMRGMVRKRVLNIFAEMYRAGGAEFDLNTAGKPTMLERVMAKYVAWKARRSR
ncbi:pyridoxal phosphate-dependent decarboxylase family protein [Sulfitobacter sp. JB4-11]|uniref:pyridoxal phosphate-dependent decarboxylase family protein n=1 Tax=Sulfitobacter rhodophyticola TaxID=3238304 RepID=UPI003D8193B0